MKKLTTNSKLIGCLMGLSIVALGTGCTDSDYDLSSVDSTIGVGGEGLELPTSSTENIILDDVLKLRRRPTSTTTSACTSRCRARVQEHAGRS